MMILDKKVSVILMKKDNEGRYLSKLNKKAKKILTEAFGGATIVPASGTWVDNGKPYKDKNYIVSCNYANRLTSKQLSAFLTVVKMEFLKGKQVITKFKELPKFLQDIELKCQYLSFDTFKARKVLYYDR